MDASMQSSSPFYNAKEFVQETDLPSKMYGGATSTGTDEVQRARNAHSPQIGDTVRLDDSH